MLRDDQAYTPPRRERVFELRDKAQHDDLRNREGVLPQPSFWEAAAAMIAVSRSDPKVVRTAHCGNRPGQLTHVPRDDDRQVCLHCNNYLQD